MAQATQVEGRKRLTLWLSAIIHRPFAPDGSPFGTVNL